jgi:hypothetical protein
MIGPAMKPIIMVMAVVLCFATRLTKRLPTTIRQRFFTKEINKQKVDHEHTQHFFAVALLRSFRILITFAVAVVGVMRAVANLLPFLVSLLLLYDVHIHSYRHSRLGQAWALAQAG